MSSYSDIVKYSATLWAERKERGHKLPYIGVVFLAAVGMISFQVALIIHLNIQSDTLLFCGDVVRNIDTAGDSKNLFTGDAVKDFNDTWTDYYVAEEVKFYKLQQLATIQQQKKEKNVKSNTKPSSRRRLKAKKKISVRKLDEFDEMFEDEDDALPDEKAEPLGPEEGPKEEEPQEGPKAEEPQDGWDEPYDGGGDYVYADEYEDCYWEDGTPCDYDIDYTMYDYDELDAAVLAEIENYDPLTEFSIENMTIEAINKQMGAKTQMAEESRLAFVQHLQQTWGTKVITDYKCTATETSKDNVYDNFRAKNMTARMQKDLPLLSYKEIEKQYGVIGTKAIFDQINEDVKANKWNCPKEWRNDKGKCKVKWNCTVDEWKKFCNGKMTFATTVEESQKPAWFAGAIILAVTVTADIYEHLECMRQAPLVFKFLLVIQCLVAINIGVLNASLTAGQSTPVDILMNSMGLLVLNDMDNIVGQMFLILRNTKDEEENDLFADNMEFRDKVFARWLAFPHLLFVLIYVIWFMGGFQFAHPEDGWHTLLLWQPYSPIFFPIILIIWYLFCFLPQLKKYRCKICFEIEEEPDDAMVGQDKSEMMDFSTVNGRESPAKVPDQDQERALNYESVNLALNN